MCSGEPRDWHVRQAAVEARIFGHAADAVLRVESTPNEGWIESERTLFQRHPELVEHRCAEDSDQPPPNSARG